MPGCSVGKAAEKRKSRSLRRTQVRGRELLYRRGVDRGVITEGEEECLWCNEVGVKGHWRDSNLRD